jgi:hypothetical protein
VTCLPRLEPHSFPALFALHRAGTDIGGAILQRWRSLYEAHSPSPSAPRRWVFSWGTRSGNSGSSTGKGRLSGNAAALSDPSKRLWMSVSSVGVRTCVFSAALGTPQWQVSLALAGLNSLDQALQLRRVRKLLIDRPHGIGASLLVLELNNLGAARLNDLACLASRSSQSLRMCGTESLAAWRTSAWSAAGRRFQIHLENTSASGAIECSVSV